MPFLSRKKTNPAPATTVGAPMPIASAPTHSHSASTSSSASSRPGTGHSGASGGGANQFGAKAGYGYPMPQQQQQQPQHGHSASVGSSHSYSQSQSYSYGSSQNGGGGSNTGYGGYQNGGGGGHQSQPSHSSQHSGHSSHSVNQGQDHPLPPVRKQSHHSSRGPSHGSASSFAAQHNYPMPPQSSQHPSGQYGQGSNAPYQQQQPSQQYGGQPAYPSNNSYPAQQQQQPYQGQTPRPPQGITGQPSFSSDASSVASNVLYDDRADRSSSAATSVSRGTAPLSKSSSKVNARQQGSEEEHEEEEDEDIEMDSRRAQSMAAAGAALSHKHAGTGATQAQPTPTGSVVPLPTSEVTPSSATPGGTASRIANLSIKSPTPSQTSSMIMRKTASRYTLSDFNIIRTLGTGSFGRVHLVRSNHNSRFYAVKVLSKERVVKMKQVEHTNSEREMLERVRHPFLVNLWGTFKDSTNLYMVMDFVAGGELFSLLRKSQRFPDPVAKFFAAEVALALDYLHSLDIIYRDLKPENILLAADGHVKITDFGFAKYVPDITWTLCGTPDYLAPEIVQSRGYNKSVDWYALGVLMFEMLAGYPPFLVQDSNPMKLYEKIIAGKIRYPSYFSPPAKELLKSLLTSDLTKRFGNLANGSQDIFTHQWFAEVDWAKLYAKQIPAPYVPRVEGEGDASCFDKYEEPDLSEYGKSGEDPYGHLFSCF